MNRLTVRSDSETAYVKNNGYIGYRDIIDKLAEYEDAEEQGLLLKLPYTVGTPVYFVCPKQGVVKDRIRRWQFNNKGLLFCANGSAYRVDAIGKSVFLTKEEAELRLRELKEK